MEAEEDTKYLLLVCCQDWRLGIAEKLTTFGHR
jgi:hypothetical protein